MNTTALPNIDFEGKLVVAKNGKYRCPHGCHTGSYPAPAWRTEKGFRQHMERCPASPSGQARKAVLISLNAEQAAQRGKEEMAARGLRIGDEIFYTGYQVTGPTHVHRGERRVRVRYEELRTYFGAAVRIESFSWLGALVLNGSIPVSNLCGSLAEAKDKAATAQKSHQEHIEFAAAVR
jgi:hypothetical protein